MEHYEFIDDNTYCRFQDDPPHFSLIDTTTKRINKMIYLPTTIHGLKFKYFKDIVTVPEHIIMIIYYSNYTDNIREYDYKCIILVYNTKRNQLIGTISCDDFNHQHGVMNGQFYIYKNDTIHFIDLHRYTSFFQAELRDGYMEHINDSMDITKQYPLQPHRINTLNIKEYTHGENSIYKIYDTTKQVSKEICTTHHIIDTLAKQSIPFDVNPNKRTQPYTDFLRTAPTQLLHVSAYVSAKSNDNKLVFKIYYDVLNNSGKILCSKLIQKTIRYNVEATLTLDYCGITYNYGLNLILITFKLESCGIIVVLDYHNHKLCHMEIIEGFQKILNINKHILTIQHNNEIARTKLTKAFPDLYAKNGKTASYCNFSQVRNVINMNIRKHKSYNDNGFLGMPNYILDVVHSYL
jgi:hypothetical protein